MVALSRTSKLTVVCVGVYTTYVLFIFFLLPMLMPDPVTLQRSLVSYSTSHLGDIRNLTLDAGGQPIRSMLVTFRGSGALTLLDNLAHQPGCYQHYAPLIAYESRSIAAKEHDRALDELAALYNCDYNKSAEMIQWGMRSPVFRRFYGAQAKICRSYSQETCWDAETMAAVCKLYPFINMAVYNMRLNLLAPLLERKDLNLNILLLVRDPRGTIYSRMNNKWCSDERDCEAQALCGDMVSDYQMVETLTKAYPQRFSIIRYEDLFLQPEESIKLVFDFYGLPLKRNRSRIQKMHPRSGYFLQSSRWKELSSQSAFEWISEMMVNDIGAVQDVCGQAMDLWGYRSIQDFNHFSPESFQPIMDKA
ncbi:carbohydrate sulfotransferase 4 [Drosophila sechellia]|uniref:GM18634 n=1 Tax=Drosophila sechellia TaxID=7238 RepID=B4I1X0_DROSE|nr:carbohydrate sulfotransferase 4 [Drosophila sechellia]EDW54527.1 GM18634 [Drosophila sechellia]